ncbi:hypothetical protein BH09VER1_BH09VER1_13710 [soil metagenome]
MTNQSPLRRKKAVCNLFLKVATCLGISASALSAATYYWDATPDGSATLDYGSGTFSSSAANWWNGTNAYSGWTNLSGDTASIGGSPAVKSYTGGTTASAFTLTLGEAITIGQLVQSGVLNSGNATTISDGGNSANTISFGGSSNVGNNSATSALIIDAKIVAAGVGGLGKLNGGTVIFLQNNTYTGGTTLSGQTGAAGGVLQIGNGGTTGSLGSGNVAFSTIAGQTVGSTLRFSRSDAITVANSFAVFSANAVGGTLEHSGSNKLTLSGNVTLGTSGSAATSVLTYKIADTTQAIDAEVSGRITGIGSIAKTGAGTMLFSNGSNNYTGTTSVYAGTLLVSGTSTASPTIVGDAANLATVAVLGGGGRVGAVTLGAASGNTGASISPGNGLGTSSGTTLNTGDFSITAGSGAHLDLQVGRTSAGISASGDVSDRVSATGTVGVSGDLKLSLLSSTGYSLAQNDVVYLLVNDSTDAMTGIFATINGASGTWSEGSMFTFDSLTWKLTYAANYEGNSFTGGNDLAIMAVPEPGTWSLLVVGVFGVALTCRKVRVKRELAV